MATTITDGGIETSLTDRLGQDLPEFAAFVLLDTDEGRTALREYYRPFLEIAATTGTPLVLDTPTWRANPDWGAALGYDAAALARLNAEAVELTRGSAREFGSGATVQIGGCVGPRFDEYAGEQRMTVDEAEIYHAPQVRALAAAGVDRITAVTMLDAAEATGIVQAARALGVPAVASFTVGADGHLADGSTLDEAIRAVDLATGGYADGFFVNCAHPSEAARAIEESAGRHGVSSTGVSDRQTRAAVDRLIGFRLNAAVHGDDGPGDSPEAFAEGVAGLRALAPAAEIFGGCCGTDAPHIAALAAALRDERA
ncbi:homocysteine S-methyltransferase family protein [Leucobacter sp. W1153]|uniref:homocysteine S-methyltransferase family protein n=1 Tax=Leucobacter sp. W1153 TaxID=3439064 RepID=UPI003F384E3E